MTRHSSGDLPVVEYTPIDADGFLILYLPLSLATAMRFKERLRRIKPAILFLYKDLLSSRI